MTVGELIDRLRNQNPHDRVVVVIDNMSKGSMEQWLGIHLDVEESDEPGEVMITADKDEEGNG